MSAADDVFSVFGLGVLVGVVLASALVFLFGG